MKIQILFIFLLCNTGLATAQTKVTDISQSSLMGKVKRITAYTFRGGDHKDPDTTANAEKTTEVFDKDGRALEEKTYDKNGALQERFLFEYFGDSVVVKNQFDSNGKLSVKYIFKYDRSGKKTEFDMKSDAQPEIRLAKINYRCLYKYDNDGNRISAEQYIDNNRLTMKTTSTFNDQHQVVQSVNESFFGSKVTESKTVFIYDNKGNSIKTETYDIDGNLTGGNSSSYDKIDKNGNWLLRTIEIRGHSQTQGEYLFKSTTKREIEYF